jgi:hypothetical protein
VEVLGSGVGTEEATVVTGARTVSVKPVLLVIPPPLAVTAIGKLPVGIELVVLIFNALEQLGLQLADAREASAPLGNPETEKETGWLEPDVKLVLIELETEDPALMLLLPELEREKLKVSVVAPDPVW